MTWGFKPLSTIDSVQNKAVRIFLGVHRFAPLAAVNGDMGWTQSQVRRHVSMFRFWNKLVCMNSSRLPRIVLDWDLSLNGKTWSHDMRSLMENCGTLHSFENKQSVNLNQIWALLHEKSCQKWKNEIDVKPKLRSYRLFKSLYQAEPYVMSFMSRSKRSVISQLRCGILPLHIETGRWANREYEQRICKLCTSGQVENEFHFLFYCSFYDMIRQAFYDNMLINFPNFLQVTDVEKLLICMDKPSVTSFGNYVCDIFNYRQRHMFTC